MNPIVMRLLKLYLDELKHGWSLSHEHQEGLLHIGDCNRDEVKEDVAATLDGYDEYVRLRMDYAMKGTLGIEDPSDADKFYAFQRRIDEELAKYERQVADLVIGAMSVLEVVEAIP